MRNLKIIAVFLLSNSVLAGDAGFDHLQIDSAACTLVHSGSMNKDIVWVGEKQFGMCSIRMNANEFSEKYSFCSLSGVLSTDGEKVMCEFGYSDTQKSKIFFMSNEKTLCEFMCVKTK